jgi:hypothetical protein
VAKQRDLYRSCLDGQESDLLVKLGRVLREEEDKSECYQGLREILRAAKANYQSYQDMQGCLMLKAATFGSGLAAQPIKVRFSCDLEAAERQARALISSNDSKGVFSFPEKVEVDMIPPKPQEPQPAGTKLYQ